MGYKPQAMKGEKAYLVDIFTVESQDLGPPQDLPVPFYGSIPWESLTEDWAPNKEKSLFRKVHPALKAVMKTLADLQETYPALVAPNRKWAIFTAPQLERERDQEHLKALKSPKKVTPTAGLALTSTGLNFLVAKSLEIRFYKGETVAHVCASGNHLLKRAQEAIEEGAQAVLLIALNSMASVVRAAYHNRLGVISKTGVIRPFHKDRDGTIMADGLAVGLVVSSSLMKATGTPPLARILGGGEVSDSYHMYGIDPEGEALQKAIEEALARGGLISSQVTLVKSHGTGTQQNDLVEAGVIKRVFHHSPPLVTAIKPYFGHTVVASALIELAHILRNIRDRGEVLPIPTTLPDQVDPLCQDLPLVLKSPSPFPPGYLLSLAAGFGGFNSAVVLEVPP